jgi:hypothetical protein
LALPGLRDSHTTWTSFWGAEQGGSGDNAIRCPAIIGGDGLQGFVFVRWTDTRFSGDARARSIVLNGAGAADNQLSIYREYPNTMVTCTGNMVFKASKVQFDSDGASPTSDLVITPLLSITSGSKLFIGTQDSPNTIGVTLTGDLLLSGSTCFIVTCGGVNGPYGDNLHVSGDANWTSNNLTVTCNVAWRNNQNFEFLVVDGSLTGDSNNTITPVGSYNPPNGWTVVAIGNNDGSMALDLQN